LVDAEVELEFEPIGEAAGGDFGRVHGRVGIDQDWFDSAR
jgi:hypothetical protein